MTNLPPGIAVVGICEPLEDGRWLVTGWSFDFKDIPNPPPLINIDDGTVCGFTYEELQEISHRHRS